MYALFTSVPISDSLARQAEIVEKAQNGPVVLVEQESKPALVAVSPELWNQLAARLDYLEDVAAVYKKKWELATGQDEMIALSPEEVEAWLMTN